MPFDGVPDSGNDQQRLVDGDIVVTTDGTIGFTITGEQSENTVTSPLDES